MATGFRSENTAITVLALCAVAVTVMMVRREFSRPVDPLAIGPPTEVHNWNSYAAGDMRIGSPRAPVTIVEFSDYECPACGQLFPVLQDVLAKYPNDVRLVYRNFPLSRIHANARAAAMAGECAAVQGRFQQYHTLLFQHQDSLGRISWSALAARAGVPDKKAFDTCLRSELPAPKLRADSLAGVALDLIGTPTVLVNKWKLNGATGEVLAGLVNQELAASRKHGG